MIDVEQRAQIRAGIDRVWAYVSNIRNWAESFPGYKACEVIDDRNSRWTVKVGAGALVRTVLVDVRIDRWEQPGLVSFALTLADDPVQGAGIYRAADTNDGETDVVVRIEITGSGPMAPVWETVSRPILPVLVRTFLEALRAKIEAQ